MKNNNYEIGSKVKVKTNNDIYTGIVTAITTSYLQIDNIRYHYGNIKNIKVL